MKNSNNYLSNNNGPYHNQQQYSSVKKSKIDIIYSLKRMPKTQHIGSSLSLQCSFCDHPYMLVRVRGSFNDGQKMEYKRDFQRTFMLKQFDTNSNSASSLKIMNDMITLTTDTGAMLDAQSQFNLVAELSRATRLHPKWAEDCLKEHSWDYTKALQSFEMLNSDNKIPEEAFVRKN